MARRLVSSFISWQLMCSSGVTAEGLRLEVCRATPASPAGWLAGWRAWFLELMVRDENESVRKASGCRERGLCLVVRLES